MFFIKDKIVKLGGIILPGQVKSIEIREAGTIEEIEDDKKHKKATQPTGYETAEISIEMIYEDYAKKTRLEQIEDTQKLFKKKNQKKPKLMTIVNQECAVRGITKAYFAEFTTKKETSESSITGNILLKCPRISVAKVKKKTVGSSSVPSKVITLVNKSKKSNKKSPAKKKKPTKSVIKTARNLVKR